MNYSVQQSQHSDTEFGGFGVLRQNSIFDVAKVAGVSASTVSRVLNNSPYVRDQTVRRVRKAVEALNYNSQSARKSSKRILDGSRRGSTGNIAVITFGLVRQWLKLPVMASVLVGICSGARDRGYRLMLDEILETAKPHRLIDRAEIDGAIVLISEDLPSIKCYEVLDSISKKIPTVWAMGADFGSCDVDRVVCDNQHVGYLAFDYLRRKSCGEFAIIAMNPSLVSMRSRAQSFINAAYDAKAPATTYAIGDDPIILDSYGKRVVPAQNAEDLVAKVANASRRPTGLFILNDENTATLMPILRRYGLYPERDVTIISCNNEQPRLAGLLPRPATIDIRPEEVGYRAIVRLVSRMGNPQETPLVVHVAARLIPGVARESFS